MNLSNYTVVKVSELSELATLEGDYYIVASNGSYSKKIKATLLKGEKGDSPKLQIGSVTTLSEGSQATAVILENDTNSYIINLGIPKGDKGDNGNGGLSTSETLLLTTAYEHSQSTHVQSSDIPKKQVI